MALLAVKVKAVSSDRAPWLHTGKGPQEGCLQHASSEAKRHIPRLDALGRTVEFGREERVR